MAKVPLVSKARGRKPVKSGPTAKAPRSTPSTAAARPVQKSGHKPRAAPATHRKPSEPRAKAAAELPAEPLIGAVERALVAQLSARLHLTAAEVVSRALHSYAAAVAPDLKVPTVNNRPPAAEGRPPQRLLLSVDGKPALEVATEEFVIGSAQGCDLRLNLPLISPRHARLLWREGRHLFEDLRSAKGSYLHGQQLEVRFLEDGDEIDLGGFLPLRFQIV